MMFASFLFLFFLTGWTSAEDNYINQDVLNYLNLTSRKDLFTMSPPVNNHSKALEVELDIMLYAILDVREIEQKFVPYIWIFMTWKNDFIFWNPEDFGGIENITIPTETLWKPDVTIEELIEKDKGAPSPYLFVNSSGIVALKKDQVVVSNCKMHVYNFPFDTQRCNLSFKSVIHSDRKLKLRLAANSSEVTKDSREVLRTQYEWQFLNVTVTKKSVNKYGLNQDIIIYTIYMKRRSMLYVINFLVPILFFLCLDLSSFLISDNGSEKLSFKITVLLAVTVMQLLLNDILPSASNWIPLIAIYCVGIFGFMLLSLVETIVVMHLIEKDSQYQDRDQRLRENCGDKSNYKHDKKVKKWCQCLCNKSSDETPADLHEDRKMTFTKTTDDTLEQVSTELKEIEKTLSVIFTHSDGERKPGYWIQKAKTLNKIFFRFYVTSVIIFIGCLFFFWTL